MTVLRRERPTGEVDLDATLRPWAMLPGDPTLDLVPGRLRRATTTPDGPATLTARWDAGRVDISVVGDGARWLAERAEGMLGFEDDPSGFAPSDPRVRATWSAARGQRIGASKTLWHDLAWLATQQRVRRAEAARAWRRLVRNDGRPAPGAADLLTPPTPEHVAERGEPALRAAGLDLRRSAAILSAAHAMGRLTPLVDQPPAIGGSALAELPGIGPWTTTCLAAFTWGDPDAVIVGDSGIPGLVSSFLGGPPDADDAELADMLEPYRPHRQRIIRLAFSRAHSVGSAGRRSAMPMRR